MSGQLGSCSPQLHLLVLPPPPPLESEKGLVMSLRTAAVQVGSHSNSYVRHRDARKMHDKTEFIPLDRGLWVL